MSFQMEPSGASEICKLRRHVGRAIAPGRAAVAPESRRGRPLPLRQFRPGRAAGALCAGRDLLVSGWGLLASSDPIPGPVTGSLMPTRLS